MTQGDRPIETHNRTLVMEDEFEGEDEYEIIEADEVDPVGMLTSDDESGSEASDQDSDRKMSCIPSTDHASFVFRKHTGPVFSIGINPQDQHMIISGGEDDKAYVWNSQTGDVLLESTDFTDSVSHAAFNHDGKYVAAIDMGGKINIWKTTTQPFRHVWDTKIDDIVWMKWHPMSNVLLVGETSGSVYMWKIPSGGCKVMSGHRELSDVGGFMPDGKRAVATFTNGVIKIFNLSTCSATMEYDSTEMDNDYLISLDTHPDNNLIAMGSLNSRLYIIKTQGSKSIHQYKCVEEGSVDIYSTSVECVAFSRKLPYNVVIAATDNALFVYDHVKSELRGYIPIEEGVTRLVWPEESHIVYIGTKVGKIAVCDVRALQRIATLEGHSQSILDITITKDRKTLITASDDGTVRIFQLEEIALNEGFPIV